MSEFKEGYGEGRAETRSELDRVGRGEGLSSDYSYKVSKKMIHFGLIMMPVLFLFLWLGLKWSFFLALIVGLVGGWLIVIVVGLLFVGVVTLAAKGKGKKQ